jgi:hypothetical protein
VSKGKLNSPLYRGLSSFILIKMVLYKGLVSSTVAGYTSLDFKLMPVTLLMLSKSSYMLEQFCMPTVR